MSQVAAKSVAQFANLAVKKNSTANHISDGRIDNYKAVQFCHKKIIAKILRVFSKPDDFSCGVNRTA